MKKFVLMIAAASVSLLPGCAALPALSAASSVVASLGSHGNTVVIEGKRSLILAHNFYQGTSLLAAEYINSDKATPAQVEAIDEANAQALRILDNAEAGLTDAQRAVMLINATNKLSALIGR